jgi:hypothetical protein
MKKQEEEKDSAIVVVIGYLIAGAVWTMFFISLTGG